VSPIYFLARRFHARGQRLYTKPSINIQGRNPMKQQLLPLYFDQAFHSGIAGERDD
jgi:hypothetical protein